MENDYEQHSVHTQELHALSEAYKAYELLAQYTEDPDGHIRKFVKAFRKSEST